VVSTIVFAGEMPAATISGRVARDELRQLARGVYTTDVRSKPTDVVKREWHTIVGGLLPEGIITDRSAPTGGPVDGVLYLAHAARDRAIELPDLHDNARAIRGRPA